MEFVRDIIAAIGVVINGIPQGILAMSLGFSIFPTTFSFVFGAAMNGAFQSVVPLSFQAESLALTGELGKNHRERVSIIFWGSLIMLFVGLSGTLTLIVSSLGEDIMAGMMAGVGVMLAKISMTMIKDQQNIGRISIASALVVYFVTKDLVWTITLSVIVSSIYAHYVENFLLELPEHVTQRKFKLSKPAMSFRILRGALSLACLNVGANISYGLLTGQMTGKNPNPVNLSLITIIQSVVDMGTSLLGGAPVEVIISATGSAPNPVFSGIVMMLIMALILFLGLLPKLGRYVPSSSIAGFLFVLGVFIIFPDNAHMALSGDQYSIAAITIVVTAIIDPFSGLLTGAVLKYILPLLGLGV